MRRWRETSTKGLRMQLFSQIPNGYALKETERAGESRCQSAVSGKREEKKLGDKEDVFEEQILGERKEVVFIHSSHMAFFVFAVRPCGRRK